MIAVLTGDIINSRSIPAASWLPILREVLSNWGDSPANWMIYRGDSFQLKTPAQQAMQACFLIKAAMRSIHLDARIGIGIGTESFSGDNIAESNGEAYIFSGQAFEQLASYSVALKTCLGKEYDDYWNLVLHLTLTFADKWTATEAGTLYVALREPALTQQQLARRLDKAQSTISETLKRAHYAELKEMLHIFQSQIKS